MLRRLLLLIACWALATPAGALAAAGPVMPVQGGIGVSMPGLPVTFVAMQEGRDTRVDRQHGGDIEQSRTLHGRLGVPGAAFDGSTTGLSADGRTLVLAGNPQQHRTRLVVLNAQRLDAPVRELSLPGYYTVDAVSPDGATIYLVHYLAPTRDLLRYEVRAYDIASERIAGGPIVDSREPDEKMQGVAITRATSPDGRWAYTLYTGEENFVHALDTAGGKAFCIDLPGGDVSNAKLWLNGPQLHVGAAITVDTRTFKVSSGGAPPPAPTATARATATPPADEHNSDGGALIWTALVIVPVAAAALALEARRRRRARVKTAA
jgi:hypothetical protein